MIKINAKILFLDIETAPIEAHVWALFDQNIGLNQITQDWSILSWAAKWNGSKRVLYEDVSKQRNKRNDSKILKSIWKLLNKADIIVGHNICKFDNKKLNARFVINKMPPPFQSRQIDTLKISKKYFSMTSNKLEYLANVLNIKYKKLKHSKFAGHDLWMECLKGNKSAWIEMKKYNIHDVLVLEEVFNSLKTWDNSINFNVYHKYHDSICICGSNDFNKDGFRYLNNGKYQSYSCNNCGKRFQSKHNELSLKKRKEMLK